MKSKLVDTVTSNEEFVRLRIFDGDLALTDAAKELIALERSQREAAGRRLAEAQKNLAMRVERSSNP